MSAAETDFRTYLKAFGDDWLSKMCGPLSVPFGALAIWSNTLSVKVLWVSLALIAFLLASYRVWRNEKNDATHKAGKLCAEQESKLVALKIENDKTVAVLQAEIQKLKRKPYREELGTQAKSLVAKLSSAGNVLLRHLLTNEPIEIGRRFLPDIAQDVQDAQMGIMYESGIVRHSIERAGSGMIVSQNYVINPEYKDVLKDVLYKA
jgi:hypothetical protein